ncbi:MAG: hypothetical protein LBP87_10355 [Planctomycetaceae bacterium]|jgi:phenylpyruvate tautomerase PptA (4-oxalocrotonate tautomerase family)|nr:hypothetical protein [Planctomycetaceae bacterium]
MNEYETLLAEITNANALADSLISNTDSSDESKKKVENLKNELVEKVTNAVLTKLSEGKEDKTVKNRNVKNTDKDDDKTVKNTEDELIKKVTNAILTKLSEGKEEKTVKNAEDELIEKITNAVLAEIGDKKDDVQNNDDDKTVKNRNVKNTDKDDDVQNQCDKDKIVSNEQLEILNELTLVKRRETDKLISGIVTNSNGVYTKEELAVKTSSELQKLYDFLKKAVQTQAVQNSSAVYGDQGVFDQGLIENADNVGLDIPSTFPATE